MELSLLLKFYLPNLPYLLGSIHDFIVGGAEETGRDGITEEQAAFKGTSGILVFRMLFAHFLTGGPFLSLCTLPPLFLRPSPQQLPSPSGANQIPS